MKHYVLLKLENNANKVLLECRSDSISKAVESFNGELPAVIQLDKDGYKKLISGATLCIAECFEPLCHCEVKRMAINVREILPADSSGDAPGRSFGTE